MNKSLSHPIRMAGLTFAVLAASATTLAVTAHPSRAAQTASIPACRTSALSAKLEPGSPGAGQRYATLVLTNRSARTCHTYGYAGLGFLDRRGRMLSTNAVRIERANRARVVLAPNASAGELLHWSEVDELARPAERHLRGAQPG